MNRKRIAALVLAISPLAAQASVHQEVASDLNQARQEVRAEMAQERAKLDSGNLTLGDSLQFGPTFNSKPQELDRLFDAVGEALNQID